MRRFYLFKIYDLKVCLNIDVEDVMVTGIEENRRGPEHFNENLLSNLFEKLQVYIYQRSADSKIEYQMNM